METIKGDLCLKSLISAILTALVIVNPAFMMNVDYSFQLVLGRASCLDLLKVTILRLSINGRSNCPFLFLSLGLSINIIIRQK